MNAGAMQQADSPLHDAALVAALLAADPFGSGGVVVRGGALPARDQWLSHLRDLLPNGAPLRRVPVHVTPGRLLGELDLALTLNAGRPISTRGLLAEADGGVLVLATAERLPPATAVHIAAALDTGQVSLERGTAGGSAPARFGVIALDEGMAGDERPPASLLDRLAFAIDLSGIGARDTLMPLQDAQQVAAARDRLGSVQADASIARALCHTAMALGIVSLRPAYLALRVAHAAAALAGRRTVNDDDAILAGRLVLAWRATALPQPVPQPPEESERDPDNKRDDDDPEQITNIDGQLEDQVLAATRAVIPPDVWAQLQPLTAMRRQNSPSGRSGALRQAKGRGRPMGARSGALHAGARLSLVETLRAAAPWQPSRRRTQAAGQARDSKRLEIRPTDFRVWRLKHRTATTAIFVVDASGSSAMHRLAEAKGAVELLLADCYVRRDQVALIGFRGSGAELLLPPTRSLVRARRSLADMAGGGGTPLAAGLLAAQTLAQSLQRRGQTPVMIVLTDGRANIAMDGAPGRERAAQDAAASARAVRGAGITTLLLDISTRPSPQAQELATAMGARYLPLPQADAGAISRAARAVVAPPRGSAASRA